jgi:hypothetical protein
MARTGRWVILLMITTSAIGCGVVSRPYAHDPLVQNGLGVSGDPTRTASRVFYPNPEPVPPRPPEPTSVATRE